MASADIGGLGAKEGLGVKYSWTPPSAMPVLIPWLVMLGLLLLRHNRNGAAWWIWLPMVCLYACSQLIGYLPVLGNSELTDMLAQIFVALTFGIGGLWLAAPKIPNRYRFITFLFMAVIAAFFGLCAFFPRFGWGGDPSLLWGGTIAVVLAGAVIAFAMVMAGRITRRRCRPALFTVAVLGALGIGWLLFLFPFMIFELPDAGSDILLPYLAGVGIFSGISFCLVLPFLLLSFASTLYGERLAHLLKFTETPPPIPAEQVSADATPTIP